MEGKWQQKKTRRQSCSFTHKANIAIDNTNALKISVVQYWHVVCFFFHLQLVSQRKKGHGHDSRVSKKNKKNNNWGAFNDSFMTSTSILSRLPWHFSIFANGILYVQKKKDANMAIYMDNTTVHVSADSIESVNNSLQQELMLVSHWIVNNKFKFKFNK